jgi:hypothetical protein
LLWGYSHYREKTPLTNISGPLTILLPPLIFFLTAVTLSASIGLRPLHSFSPTLSLIFFSLTILLFALHSRPFQALQALIAGQAIASLHSILDGSFPHTLPSLFLGKVTESGQLAISIFITLGVLWREFTTQMSQHSKSHLTQLNLLGGITAIVIATCAFRHDTGALATPLLIAGLGWGICAAVVVFRITSLRPTLSHYAWYVVGALPLLLGALLVNLKRGPWFGVTVGVAIFFAFFARKLLGIWTALALLAVLAFPSIQTRLADSYADFTISGGRSTIWKIGAELCAQYPLGVGYRNSGVLRSFAREIPEELDHFHNNLLNITAENGWLASLLFIWFVVTAIRLCFAKPRDPLLVALGCGVISWQIAGLVEYNAGDAEVLVLMWMMLGIAMKLLATRQPLTAAQ